MTVSYVYSQCMTIDFAVSLGFLSLLNLQLLQRFQIDVLELTGTILTGQKIIAHLLIVEAGENVLHDQQLTDLGSLSDGLCLVVLRTRKKQIHNE